MCDSCSAWLGRWVGGGSVRSTPLPGALGSSRADLGARSPQFVCGPPRCARVVSPTPRPLHCVPRLLSLGPHPQGLTASVRRWKNRTSPPPSALGETEAYRWGGPCLLRDSGVTRDPVLRAFWGPSPGWRACPYIPRQGEAITPFSRVRPRLTRLESLAQVLQWGWVLKLVLPDSCVLP